MLWRTAASQYWLQCVEHPVSLFGTVVKCEDGIMLFQPGSFADPYRAYGVGPRSLFLLLPRLDSPDLNGLKTSFVRSSARNVMLAIPLKSACRASRMRPPAPCEIVPFVTELHRNSRSSLIFMPHASRVSHQRRMEARKGRREPPRYCEGLPV